MDRSRQTRAVLLALSVIICSALMTSGCRRGPEEREVVRFWHSFGARSGPGDAIDELVARFNREQEEIEVRALRLPGQEIIPKLLTSVAGRVPPDVVLFNRPFLAGFIARGAFRPMDDLVERDDIRGTDYFSAAWEGNRYDGRVYGMPFNTDVRVLFYNRRHFVEAGMDPDRPPRTWRELADVSERLTVRREDGRLERVGFAPLEDHWGNTYLYLYAWQNGGRFLDDDGRRLTLTHPKNVEALEWMTERVRAVGYDRLQALQSGFTGDFYHPFFTGKLSMTGNEGYLLSQIRIYAPDLDFAVAPLPYPEDGVHATWSGGYSLAIPSETRNVAGAWRFIRWMTGPEQQSYYGRMSDQLPALRVATQDAYFQEDPAWRVFVSEMEYSRPLPRTPVAMEMFDELRFAMAAAYDGASTPREALERAQTVCQTSLDTYRGRTEWAPIPERALTVGFVITLAALAVGWLYWRRASFLGATAAATEARWGVIFTAPAIVGFLVLVAAPAVLSAVYSLCDYGVLQSARWAGLENYRELFAEDRRFWLSLWNTFYYVAFSVPLGMAVALVAAVFLQRATKMNAIGRTLVYLPAIMPTVAMAVLWLMIFNADFGLLNATLRLFGVEGPLWMRSVRWSKPSLILMSLWGVGPWMVIYVAALQGIPGHLLESASLDGAGAWARFRHITVPLISPSLFFTAVIGCIAALQMFTQVYVMTMGEGGPLDSTMFYVLYLYRKAFNHVEMGYASAMAWILFWVVLVLTAIQFAASRRWVHYES